MIFTSLVLENIGSFHGHHEIDLQPPHPDKPIVLIGALNGSGKTTLLESFQLALYGRRAKSLFRISGSYDDYLTSLRSRKANRADGAKIALTLQNDESGTKVLYRIVRTWSYRAKQPTETVDVYVNDLYDPTLSETWDEEVERLVPRNLAHLFFFDGERIEKLADPAQSADILRIGIHSLLGIELVDQLQIDLNVYRRRIRKQSASPGDHRKLAALEVRVNAAEATRRRLCEEIASFNNRVAAAQSRVRTTTERFERHGGRIFENHRDLEREKSEVTAMLEEVDHTLRAYCSGSLPFLVARMDLEKLAHTVKLEHDSRKARILVDMLGERDEQLIGWISSSELTNDLLIEDLRHHLECDRENRRSCVELPHNIQMGDAAFLQLSRLLSEGLHVERERAKAILERRRRIKKRLAYIERSLSLLPEEAVIRNYVEAKVQAQAEFNVLMQEKGRLEQQLSQAKADVVQSEKNLERELSHLKQAELGTEESSRLGDYSEKVQDVLRQLRHRTLSCHLLSLESHISRAFKRLLHKESLVERIAIDPDAFTVKLISRDGHSITPQLLSAGERQILAIALLWGLGQAAGRKMPIVIDTPLGRLDGPHRQQLVEQYFPDASHQVILLSTDEEIDEALFGELDDSLGHTYMLDYNDHNQSTSVTRGYFWQSVGSV